MWHVRRRLQLVSEKRRRTAASVPLSALVEGSVACVLGKREVLAQVLPFRVTVLYLQVLTE